MLVTYPAVFYYEDESKNYSIFFSDIPHGGTQGESIDDCFAMASDWLGIMVADYIEKGEQPPIPSNVNQFTPLSYHPFADDSELDFVFDLQKSFVSYVSVELNEYLELQEPVKKHLPFPNGLIN